jgi:cytochrome c551/c552
MQMKKVFVLLSMISLVSLIFACGGEKSSETDAGTKSSPTTESTPKGNPKYDPNRGEGKWNTENLALGATLDAAMAESGSKIQSVKCSSCHKLSNERLVGPGWKGVTNRRQAEWIMNFIANPDPMIDKDPVVQAQLELCLVRMPNQNLSDTEAREILEFMRKNDGVQ